jgi:hypothetical protein
MSDLKVEWDLYGNVRSVRGPAYRMVTLPVGAMGKYGPITEYTSEWARLDNEKIADSVTMIRPRQSGHEIEGRVKIGGKTYSAFTSADFGIIVRGFGSSSVQQYTLKDESGRVVAHARTKAAAHRTSRKTKHAGTRVANRTGSALDAAVREAERLGKIAQEKSDAAGDDRQAHKSAEYANDNARLAYWQAAMLADRQKADALQAIAMEFSAKQVFHAQRVYQIRRVLWESERDVWASRETLDAQGQPPSPINVLDNHGGFTAVTRGGNTLWRPGAILSQVLPGALGLKRGTTGALQSFDPKSFYQTNNDVTKAIYKVPGYGYPVAVWFDNKTKMRIA